MLRLAHEVPERFVNSGRALRKLRRLAPVIGRWAAVLLPLYEEVRYRPGNQGAISAKSDFERRLQSGVEALQIA